MKSIGLILIVLIVSSCQSDNVDFNPFDNEFRFHRNFKVTDYDTLIGECGYWNLTKKDDRIKTYYQFYLDEKPIVAKGFILDIDEISIFDKDSLNSESYVLTLLENHPIDFELVKQRLAIFKIKEINIIEPTDTYMVIDLIDINDSTYRAELLTDFEDNKITRQLQYFNGKTNGK